MIGLLERAARLDRDEPPEAQLAKLEAVLGRSSDRLDEVVPLLAALLGVPTGERYPALTLTPEVQKRRTLQALVDQLAGLAAQQPVLALYEDVHWIDPSTLELLGLVIERIRRLPVLVLITFRPEFQPPWTGQAHVTTLTMSRLGRRQGADLVARVTGDKPLPAEIVEQIVARTDGVPLFVEELTKTVLESGLLADAGDHYELSGPLPPLAIPTTLHDSLMARLDRLAPVKEVAQIGAVIGREFSHELLAAVAPLSANLAGRRPRSAGRLRAGLPPRRAARGDLQLQARAGPGRGLPVAAQVQAPATASPASPRCSNGTFPQTAETEPEILAHHFTEAGLAQADRLLASSRTPSRRAVVEQGSDSSSGEGNCIARHAASRGRKCGDGDCTANLAGHCAFPDRRCLFAKCSPDVYPLARALRASAATIWGFTPRHGGSGTTISTALVRGGARVCPRSLSPYHATNMIVASSCRPITLPGPPVLPGATWYPPWSTQRKGSACTISTSMAPMPFASAATIRVCAVSA